MNNSKKCAFFENRICDESCMAYFQAFHQNGHEPTFSCKRMIITIPTDKTPIF